MARKQRELVLTLSGRRDKGGYVVEVGGVAEALSQCLFCALCQLADARLAPGAPPVPLSKGTVLRLRRNLDLATGQEGLGKQLIWFATKHKYVLARPAETIFVDPSLENVLLTGCLDRALAERLLAAARTRNSGKATGSIRATHRRAGKRSKRRGRRDM